MSDRSYTVTLTVTEYNALRGKIAQIEAALRRWVPLSSPFTDEQMDERVEWQRDHALAFAGTSLERSAESDGSLQELRQFAHYIDERLIAVERQLETKGNDNGV